MVSAQEVKCALEVVGEAGKIVPEGSCECTFRVVESLPHEIVLGVDYLSRVNPAIDWDAAVVSFGNAKVSCVPQ